MTTQEKFEKSAAEYLSRLALENLSPRTEQNYRSVLSAFAVFLAQTPQPDEYAAAAAWRKRLSADGLTPATVRQYLTVLQIFFKAASHRSYPAPIRYGPENPVDAALLPKVPPRPYEQVLTDELVRALYRPDPPKNANRALWPRNYAMLMLCLNEKIRNAELLDLRLSDVDMAAHILTVRSGKGRKWREVDLTELTEEALTRYLTSGLRPACLGEEDYLFGTCAAHERGAPDKREDEAWHRGTGQWLSGVIERAVASVTGVPDVRSHDLRHIGSRVCLNAGQSIEELQGQLGHAQYATTQLYCSRMGSRRARESAKQTLTARAEAAEQLRKKNEREQNLVRIFA